MTSTRSTTNTDAFTGAQQGLLGSRRGRSPPSPYRLHKHLGYHVAEFLSSNSSSIFFFLYKKRFFYYYCYHYKIHTQTNAYTPTEPVRLFSPTPPSRPPASYGDRKTLGLKKKRTHTHTRKHTEAKQIRRPKSRQRPAHISYKTQQPFWYNDTSTSTAFFFRGQGPCAPCAPYTTPLGWMLRPRRTSYDRRWKSGQPPRQGLPRTHVTVLVASLRLHRLPRYVSKNKGGDAIIVV